MNIFSSLTHYESKWEVASTRDFNQEEIDAVESAVVVSSQYGNSVKFTMRGGGATYLPLDRNSSLGVGEAVDITKAKLVKLSKPGENPINRVLI